MGRELLESSTKSRRPKDSPFFQQRLPAWQPMFTAKKSAVMFIVLGVILIPLGILLVVTSNNTREYAIDYTDCVESVSGRLCSDLITSGLHCHCVKQLRIDPFLTGPVFLYYSLQNFYQNHRRYARSMSSDQLLGVPMKPNALTSCQPLSSCTDSNDSTFAILPCGLIANSIFNDTFEIYYQDISKNISVSMTNEGIAWPSDIERKYGHLTTKALINTVKPPNWPLPVQAQTTNPFKSYEELMVWMRIAALPNFRKLHRIILDEGVFIDGLPAGVYNILINYTYPVTSFNGRKILILSNSSWMGGKNITLGVTFLLTGSLHLLFGFIFLFIHLFWNKRKARRSPPIYS